MARTNTATGIILKRHDYGEADRVITLCSKERGKCVLIAKGVRKINSKRKGHLELFSHVQLSFVEREGWGILTEVETIEQFDSIIHSWERLGNAFHIGEIIDRLLPEQEQQERVYTIFLRYLRALEGEGDPTRQEEVVRLCEQTLLDELGYWNTEEFGAYNLLNDKNTAKDRNVQYIQNILERELKSIRIFDTPRPLYLRD